MEKTKFTPGERLDEIAKEASEIMKKGLPVNDDSIEKLFYEHWDMVKQLKAENENLQDRDVLFERLKQLVLSLDGHVQLHPDALKCLNEAREALSAAK